MTEVTRYDLTEDVATGVVDITPVPESMEGRYVGYEDYTELKAQRDALAAENAALKDSVDHAAGCIHAAEVEGLEDALESHDGERLADLVHRRLCHAHMPVDTPATDAYLNSVRAEGVEALAKILQAMIDAGDFAGDEIGAIAGAVDAGNYHAAQLRGR